MKINYISIKETIGRFLREYNIDDSSYISDIPIWIEEAISLIGIPNYYVIKKAEVKIDQNKGILPCDIEHIYGYFVSTNCEDGVNKNNYRRLVIRNAPLIGIGINSVNHETAYGTVDGNFLNTSFYKGKVMVVYKGIPMDCDGFPLVPKNAEFNQAIQFYFIYRMALSGFKHPIISFDQAYQLWEKHYPRAGNSINWMDLQEYQEFTEMWTNPIIGDLSNNHFIF